ncbi:single-stranded DNA-binding protein [Oceanobacter kriegii]|uniref:single-stranded DNA-binding protein n=1 Tax=Oceanobacter kriegii TaxID=64972 RepID=UPI0006856DCF|nr:single-stranded DNA-binding protein [Oceanobacter kriegii]
MIRIEVLQGHHLPQQRPTKNGIRYYQLAYAHLGGAFPVEIQIPLRGVQDAYPVGLYEPDLPAFQVSRWGNLELNPFELPLVPLNEKPVSQQQKTA